MTDSMQVSGAIKRVETVLSNENVTKRRSTMNNSPEPLKIIAVGDAMVGKTWILIKYTLEEFPEKYVPTTFENFLYTIEVDGVPYEITFYDTPGHKYGEGLRSIAYYPSPACFLLCYSISCKRSFDNILQKWYPELKDHCPSVPIILVGTKSDLRGTEQECVTQKMAKEMKKKISAYKALECSALENMGLHVLLLEAVRCAVNSSNKNKRYMKIRSPSCTVL